MGRKRYITVWIRKKENLISGIRGLSLIILFWGVGGNVVQANFLNLDSTGAPVGMVTGHHHFLASTSTLLYPGGTEYAHHILMSPSSFENHSRAWGMKTINDIPHNILGAIFSDFSLMRLIPLQI